MKREVTKELLERFFEGKCTAEEEHNVFMWLNSESGKDLMHKIERDWMNLEEADFVNENEFEPRFDELEKKINRKGKIIKLKPWMKVAASLLLVAAFSMVLFFYHQSKNNTYITKSLQKGNPSVFTFNDGTKVTLSAGSTISYPAKLTRNKPVYLKGEAYFDIPSHMEVTIYAGNVKTKATQSSLNISAFPDDKEVVVSVVEGKAEVSENKEHTPMLDLIMPKTLPLTKLRPAVVVNNNEYLAIDNKDQTVNKGEDFDKKEVFAWKEGIIYFKNADSTKMIKKLERWYGVDIKVVGCLGQKTFSGEFSNKSIDEIITAFKTDNSSNIEFKRNGNEVLISGTCL